MVKKLESALPTVCRNLVAYHQCFAIKPLSASLPSLCHGSPCGFVLKTTGKPGHAFAFSGMVQKFL
jgi:hypothetical protein